MRTVTILIGKKNTNPQLTSPFASYLCSILPLRTMNDNAFTLEQGGS